jgi:urease beta subunit
VQVTAGGLRQNIANPTPLRFAAGKTDKVTVAVKAQAEPQKPWTVKGTVNDATGAVVSKTVVRISDKEGKLAERFGKKTTNAKGEFEFTFEAEKFTDVIASKVDLFVQVVNADDKVLAQSTALKFEPGKTDTVQIAMRK